MIKAKDIQRIIVANETAQEASIEIKKMVDKYVKQQVKLFATPAVSNSVCPDCAGGRDPFEPDWKCPECRQTDR